MNEGALDSSGRRLGQGRVLEGLFEDPVGFIAFPAHHLDTEVNLFIVGERPRKLAGVIADFTSPSMHL